MRRGVAAVEFAVVAPLFFLLVIGMIEYGGYIRGQQLLTNLSRDMARAAATDRATVASIEAYKADWFDKAGITAPIQVVWTPLDPAKVAMGEPIQATASVSFSDLSLCSPFFLKTAVVQATTVMRKEGTQ
jgi:hypothetical protein